ncbi:MAG TPA: biotin synthase BioB [Syntrophales bacterium]|nr:biotin synthase BioB [Syntrophales bacterium]HPO36280.1 biotin synthase BioB [Syntrophales bacterium]
MGIAEKLKEKCLAGRKITANEALILFEEGVQRPYHIMAVAGEIREHFKGREINLCAIVNAKSGRCSEDCAFCAQSAHWRTGAPVFPLKSAEEIVREAKGAKKAGAEMFGIVTSGKKLRREKEWQEMLKAVEMVSKLGLKPCASLGMLEPKRARQLKEAGLFRYHHNLETARSFFPRICTTHDYEEDVETIEVAKAVNLSVCSGGIIGLGEGVSHRIELALTLRELEVDSVPLNFLNPIKGTPLYKQAPLSPLEILVTISVMRFLLPDKDLRLCGGKEKNLRQLLPLAVIGGANAIMTGNYLTTTGRDPACDHELIQDLGLKATREFSGRCRCEGMVEIEGDMS